MSQGKRIEMYHVPMDYVRNLASFAREVFLC